MAANCTIEEHKYGKVAQVFTPVELERSSKLINILIGEVVFKVYKKDNLTITDLSDPTKVGDIYAEVNKILENAIMYSEGDTEVNDDYLVPALSTEMIDKLSVKTLNSLINLADNFELFQAYHLNNGGVFKLKTKGVVGEESNTDVPSLPEDDVEGSEVQDNTVVQMKDKAANEFDSYLSVSPNIKTLFKFLYEVKWDTTKKAYIPRTTSNKLPINISDRDSYNLYMKYFNNIKSEEELINKFFDETVEKIIPFVVQLREMLRLRNPQQTDNDRMLFLELATLSAMPEVNSQVLVTTQNESSGRPFEFMSSPIAGNRKKIIDIWNLNFTQGNVKNTNIFGRRYLTRDEIDRDTNDLNSAHKILNAIGIELSRDIIRTLGKNEEKSINTQIKKAARDIKAQLILAFNSVNKGGKETFILNPIKDLKEDFYKNTTINSDKSKYKELKKLFVKNVSKTIDGLIDIESKISRVAPSNSQRNAIGEMTYMISNETNITVGINALNKSKTVNDLLNQPIFSGLVHNPYWKYSFYKNYLFPDGSTRDESKNIELTYVSGVSIDVNDGAKLKKLSRDLTAGQKIVNDVKSMLGYGRTDTMRLETSNSYPAITMKSDSSLNYVQKNHESFFNLVDFNNGIFSSPKVQSLFLGYLKAELEKIKLYPELKKDNVNISSQYGDFLIFDKLDPQLKEDLKVTKEEITLTNELGLRFIENYTKILQDKADLFKRKFIKEELSYKDIIPFNIDPDFNPYGENWDKQLDPRKANILNNSFIMNTMVQNIEFSILYTGDPSLYETVKTNDAGEITSITTDLPKRMKGLSSTGVYTNVSPTSNRLIEQDKYIQNYSLEAMTASKFKKKFEPRVHKETRSMVVEEIFYDGKFKEYKDKTTDKASDGQGWASIDFLYRLSIRQAWRNEFTDQVFKYESLIYKREFLKQPLSNEELLTISEHEKNVIANPDRYAIPVMKAGYFGNQINSNIDGKIYDKFSLAPLLPSWVISSSNTKLRNLMESMIDNQLDYVKYPSGTKGYIKKIVPVNDVRTAEADLLHTELFKLQLSYSNESSVNTPIPTQLLKLIYSNEFSSGVPNNKAIGKLYTNYITTLNEIQKENINSLFKSLGIKYIGDDFEVDTEKFVNSVFKQAILREFDTNVLSVLQYDPIKKNFAKDPEKYGYVGEIEKILSGLVDKHLRRFTVNGGDFTLVTNAMSALLKFYEKSKGKIRASEARITLTKEYAKLLNQIDPDTLGKSNKPFAGLAKMVGMQEEGILDPNEGKPIGTLKRLNELLKNPEWRAANIKALQIIVDRVPTQELNSMDALEIVEFLSPSMGNMIQLPNEIVIKAGLDFDYDKEKVLLPTLDKFGKFVEFKGTREKVEKEINYIKDTKRALIEANVGDVEAMYQEFDAAVEKLKEEVDINQLKGDYKKLFDNIKVLKSEIENSTEEMSLLLREINEQKTLDGLPEMQSSHNLFASIFGNIDTLNIELEDLDNEYLQEQSDQQKRLEDLHSLYQRQIDLYNTQSNYFGKIDQFAEAIKEHESSFTREISGYNKQLDDLYYKKQNYFNNLSNKIVQNYHEALLKPNRFGHLIRPNSAAKIKAVSKIVSSVTKINRQLPTRDLIFDYSSQLDIFDIYNTAKSMLGPYAKINTVEKLLNYAGIKMNPFIIDAVNNRDSNGKRKVGKRVSVNHLLLNAAEKALNSLPYGKYDISSKLDIEGQEVQETNSQTVNATVDAAKDPFFINLMINYANVGVDILFTSLFKYPYERTKFFLAHPVNLLYAKKKNNGHTEGETLAAIGNRLKIKTIFEGEATIPAEKINTSGLVNGIQGLTFDPKTNTYKGEKVKMYVDLDKENVYEKGSFRDFLLVINEGITPSASLNNLFINGVSLTKFVTRNSISTDAWKKLADPMNDSVLGTSKEFTKNQLIDYDLRISANFFAATKLNKSFRALSNYISFDTNKLDGIFGIMKRRGDRRDILKSNIISEEDLIKLEKNSVQGAFKNEDSAEIAFQNYAPIITDNIDNLYDLYEEYTQTFSEKTKTATKVLPNIIMNEFMYSIIHNFGKKSKNGYNQITSEGKDGIIFRMVSAKRNPDNEKIYKNHPILDQLIGEFNDAGSQVLSNIKLIKSLSLSKLDKESFIQQFRELLSEDNFSKDSKTNDFYKKLVRDIADLSLAQSGLSSSYLSFREFIPVEYFEEDFEEAFEAFSKSNSLQKYYYMNNFKNVFKKNNRNYFPEEKITDSGIKYKDYKNPKAQLLKEYTIDPVAENSVIPEDTRDLMDKFDRAARMKPIRQNFKDGQLGRMMRPEFKGKTTMELVLSGDRTRTTRSDSEMNRMITQYQPKDDDVKNLVGIIVKQSDNIGNYVYTEITGVHELTQEYQDATWLQEGWEKSVTDKLVGNYPYAIEFKVVERPLEKVIIDKDGNASLETSFQQSPNYTPTQEEEDAAFSFFNTSREEQDESDSSFAAFDEVTKVLPSEVEKEVTQALSLSPEEELGELQYKLETLLDIRDESAEDNPYLYILDGMGKISEEDAQKQTGGVIGQNKDINKNLVSPDGKTVAQTAHDIAHDNLPDWFTLDLQDVENEIITILTMGKDRYRKENTSSNEIRNLRDRIDNLKERMKESIKEGSHVTYQDREGIVLDRNSNKINVVFLDTNKPQSLSLLNLIPTGQQSTFVKYAGYDYIVTENNVLDIKGKPARMNSEIKDTVIALAATQNLPNLEC